MAEPDHTDEQVLADPGSFTVEQVQAVLARSSPDDVDAAKANEESGQHRKGIVEWQPPAPKTQAGESAFSRERLLGADGPLIVGHPSHVIAGALHDDQRDGFSREQAVATVEKFLRRPVETDD